MVVLNVEVVVLMFGILRVHLISLRVIIVNQLRQLFKLLIEVSLVLVVTLIREVINLWGFHILVSLDVAVILG